MKRLVFLLAVVLAVVSCATMQQGGPGLVSRAVQVSGGVDALAGVRTVYVKGTVKEWDPESAMTAGGEMRFTDESAFESYSDVASGATRTEWSRKFAYPAPRTFTYTEIVTPEAGYVAGIDSNSRTKQSLESSPPQHTMSGPRLAAAQRELRRGSPLLLLDMMKQPDRVALADSVSVGGVAHPAVNYRVGDQTFTVMFDSGTGLPARIRSLDYDNQLGDVTYDLVLSDWQTVQGLRVPMTRKYELNGRAIVEIKLAEVAFNTAFPTDQLRVPEAFRAGASKPATGPVPYQWILRRQFVGILLDSSNPSYDTQASPGLRLVELAPGTQFVMGGTHNNLIVEMSDHLVVFDAPVTDWQSNWVLAAAKAKYPNKPVKFLVLTHHHMDHSGGFRAYAAQGATIVIGEGAAAHYRRLLAAPFTRNPDLASRDLSRTQVVGVVDKWVHSDGKREVHAYVVAQNPHSDPMLIGYVPDARLGYVVDIWNPGAPLPDKLNPALASVIATVKKAGISPVKFAGGHASTADYAPLAALEGK
jgi:metallo-beta-lactamase superfamily protein